MARPAPMNSRPPPPPSLICLECEGEFPADLPRLATDSCREALADLIGGHPGRWCLLVRSGGALEAFARQLARETGVRCEVIAGDGGEWRAVADACLVVYAGQRPIAPAALGAGAARWVAVRMADGQRWYLGASEASAAPTWLEQTLAQAGVSLADSVELILERSRALEEFAVRTTRRQGRMLVAIEALCVLLPAVWLLRTPLALPPMMVALVGLASPLLILSSCWWLRRRSTGLLGPRARLVNEACRSWLATHQSPARPVFSLLSAAPALRPLLQKFVAEGHTVGTHWRADYLRERIDRAHAQCMRVLDEARCERDRTTRWHKLLLDLALIMSAAGLAISLHPRSASWLAQLGGSWFGMAFSLAGMALPLGLLATQSLRWADRSRHRARRCARQRLHLENLRERFEGASDEAAIGLLHECESVLLSEVLDGHCEAETGEAADSPRLRSEPAPSAASARDRATGFAPARKDLGGLGITAGRAVRLMLGSLAWMALGGALVLMWISFKQPETAEVSSRLQELGRMLDPWSGEVFTPQPAAAAHGTLVITHGMRDGWHRSYRGSDFACGGPRAHWTTEIAEQVRRRTGAQAPQIIVLDWNEGAKASSRHALNTQDPVTRFLADLGGVRSSAEVTGDFLGIRLARMVETGQIRRDRPLQLIGHSAGGLLVARAAQIVVAMGYPKDLVHLTLLDTPEPSQELDRYATSEFYRTSNLTQVGPGDLGPGIHYARIPLPERAQTSEKSAHDYAPDWYCQSAFAAPCGSDGFGRSPFCG